MRDFSILELLDGIWEGFVKRLRFRFSSSSGVRAIPSPSPAGTAPFSLSLSTPDDSLKRDPSLRLVCHVDHPLKFVRTDLRACIFLRFLVGVLMGRRMVKLHLHVLSYKFVFVLIAYLFVFWIKRWKRLICLLNQCRYLKGEKPTRFICVKAVRRGFLTVDGIFI